MRQAAGRVARDVALEREAGPRCGGATELVRGRRTPAVARWTSRRCAAIACTGNSAPHRLQTARVMLDAHAPRRRVRTEVASGPCRLYSVARRRPMSDRAHGRMSQSGRARRAGSPSGTWAATIDPRRRRPFAGDGSRSSQAGGWAREGTTLDRSAPHDSRTSTSGATIPPAGGPRSPRTASGPAPRESPRPRRAHRRRGREPRRACHPRRGTRGGRGT